MSAPEDSDSYDQYGEFSNEYQDSPFDNERSLEWLDTASTWAPDSDVETVASTWVPESEVQTVASIFEHDPPSSHSNSAQTSHKRGKNLPPDLRASARLYVATHSDNPYPSKQMKQDLCKKYNVSMKTVNILFANTRARMLRVLQGQQKIIRIVVPYNI